MVGRSLLITIIALLSAAPAAPAAAQTSPVPADRARVDSLLAEGLRLRRAGQLDSAAAAYTAAMRLDPAHAGPAAGLGWVAMLRGDYGRAADWFERARRVSDDPGLDVSLGQAYTNLAGRSRLRRIYYARKARSAYDRAIGRDSTNVHALEPLIRWHLVVPRALGGNRGVARQLATKLGQVNPVLGRVAAGQIAEAEGNTAGAERAYRAAVTEFPDSVSGYLALAGMYERGRDHRRAISALDLCTLRMPQQDACAYQLGKHLALDGREPDRAIEILTRYLAGLPEDARSRRAGAMYYLGVAYEGRGDRAQAEAMFKRAAELDPGAVRGRKERTDRP